MSFAGLLPCLRAICGTHRHKSNLLKEDDLPLSKKSGFCLCSERAVVMAGFFFPCHFLEFQLCSG